MIDFKINRQVDMVLVGEGNTALNSETLVKTEQVDYPVQHVELENLLLMNLDKYWANFIRQLTVCQESASVPAVHDVRVATRRLITFFELLQIHFPFKQIVAMKDELKLLREHFDALRDTQVMIVEMTELSKTIMGIDPFLEYLNKREFRYKAEVAQDISTYKLLKNTRKLNIAREKLHCRENDYSKFEKKTLRYVDESYALLNKRIKKLDPAKPLTFHAVRIACRKFRYQVEVINSMFVEYPIPNMTILKAFQDKLGEIQNHKVMETILKKFTRKNPEHNLDEVKVYLDKKLEGAINMIMTEDAHLELLWRTSAKEKFPWILTPVSTLATDEQLGGSR